MANLRRPQLPVTRGLPCSTQLRAGWPVRQHGLQRHDERHGLRTFASHLKSQFCNHLVVETSWQSDDKTVLSRQKFCGGPTNKESVGVPPLGRIPENAFARRGSRLLRVEPSLSV